MYRQYKILIKLYATHIVSVILSIFLLFTIILYLFKLEASIHQESCTQMEVKLEKNHKLVFCINETTSILQTLNIYDIQKRVKLVLYDLYESYEMTKSLEACFKGDFCTTKKLKLNNDKYCPYIQQEEMVNFCFDWNKLISHITLSDKLIMNPHEAYHLLIYMKVFFK